MKNNTTHAANKSFDDIVAETENEIETIRQKDRESDEPQRRHLEQIGGIVGIAAGATIFGIVLYVCHRDGIEVSSTRASVVGIPICLYGWVAGGFVAKKINGY